MLFNSTEFKERLHLLGHDWSTIEQGEESCTYFTLPTVMDARRVLSMATTASRLERQKTGKHAWSKFVPQLNSSTSEQLPHSDICQIESSRHVRGAVHCH